MNEHYPMIEPLTHLRVRFVSSALTKHPTRKSKAVLPRWVFLLARKSLSVKEEPEASCNDCCERSSDINIQNFPRACSQQAKKFLCGMLGILPSGSKFDKRGGSLVDRVGYKWSLLRGRWRLQFLQLGGWV